MAIDPAETEAADGLRGEVDRRHVWARVPRWSRRETGSRPDRGLGADRSKLAVGGSVLFFKARSTLSRPAAPAAVRAWPTFDLTEPIAHWPVVPAGFAPERLEALDLDGVADRRAGGVALDQIDVARAPAGLLVGHPHGPELTFGAGGQQVAVDVVGEADPGDERVNMIAVRQRIVEALEHEHARPFADHQPVGAVIERSGLAARRQGAKLREAHLRVERIGRETPPQSIASARPARSSSMASLSE